MRTDFFAKIFAFLLVMAIPAVGMDAKRKSSAVKKIELSDDVRQLANHTPCNVRYYIGSPRVEVIYYGDMPESNPVIVSESNRCVRLMNQDSEVADVMDDIEIKVWSQDIGTFSTFGAGSISADKVASVNILLQAFGTGDITVGRADGGSLKIDVYGVASVNVGEAKTVSLKTLLQGAGDINVRSVECSSVDAIMQGAGDIRIEKIDAVTVNALNQGVGNIDLSGKATSAKYIIQGVGEINARNLKATRVSKLNQGLGSIHD